MATMTGALRAVSSQGNSMVLHHGDGVWAAFGRALIEPPPPVRGGTPWPCGTPRPASRC